MAMKLKDIKGFGSIRDSFRTRQVRYGGYAALITLAVIVGLILANLIVGQFSPQIDMTEGGLFSLTDQSLQVIDMIKTPVIFYGLWRAGDENSQLIEVIDLYMSRSRNIRLEVVDPNKNPGLVSRFDKANQGIPNGSLVVEGEKGSKVITPMDMYDFSYNQSGNRSLMGISMERRITSALLFVATGHTPVLYEITGHQELSLSDINMQGVVERENFLVRQLNLIQSPIPQDASSLIINAPRSDISRGEADRILDFLEKGGRLLVLADYRIRELPVLNEVMASYGMRFDYGYLLENDSSYTAGAAYFAVPDLLEHDITKPLTEQKTPVMLPFSMGVSEGPAKRRSVELKPLLASSSNSFLRTDLEEESPSRVRSDIPGPITIGMTAKDPSWIQGNEPQARIAAIACGSLLEPISYFGQIPGNIDLFMNTITWLEDRPETLTVRSKSMFLLPMRISGFQMILYGVIFVILIPLGFFISGFIIWLRRRHL
jgi:hypothetical protein